MTEHLFQPVNDDHAIDRVEFALTFARAFNAHDLKVVRDHHELWQGDLPRVAEPTVFAFNMGGPNKPVRPEPVAGLEFSFVRPDGSAVWALRLLGNHAAVECTRYSRWAKVWGAAQRYLESVVNVFSYQEPPNPIANVALTVVDVFTTEAAAYDLSALLQEGDLLPAASFKRGVNWHAYSGWFQTGDCRVLHNVNIDSVELPPGPAGTLASVSITHSMVLTRLAIPEVVDREADKVWLSQSMENLHLENKSVVATLVIPALLQRIGLKAFK